MIERNVEIQPSWVCRGCHEDKPIADYTWVRGANHSGMKDIEVCRSCKAWLRTPAGMAFQLDCANSLAGLPTVAK